VRKHPLDLTSLLAGLVFVALAAVYLLAAATGNHVDASWVLPLALVALGLAGLAGGITRAVRRPAPAPATTETIESSETTGAPTTSEETDAPST
jgi:hypothetical protein